MHQATIFNSSTKAYQKYIIHMSEDSKVKEPGIKIYNRYKIKICDSSLHTNDF